MPRSEIIPFPARGRGERARPAAVQAGNLLAQGGVREMRSGARERKMPPKSLRDNLKLSKSHHKIATADAAANSALTISKELYQDGGGVDRSAPHPTNGGTRGIRDSDKLKHDGRRRTALLFLLAPFHKSRITAPRSSNSIYLKFHS